MSNKKGLSHSTKRDINSIIYAQENEKKTGIASTGVPLESIAPIETEQGITALKGFNLFDPASILEKFNFFIDSINKDYAKERIIGNFYLAEVFMVPSKEPITDTKGRKIYNYRVFPFCKIIAAPTTLEAILNVGDLVRINPNIIEYGENPAWGLWNYKMLHERPQPTWEQEPPRFVGNILEWQAYNGFTSITKSDQITNITVFRLGLGDILSVLDKETLKNDFHETFNPEK